jgi:hypothetical protein
VTYRLLDGYFVVLLLRESGVEPGPAQDLFERAEALSAALVPAWRQAGIYNLRRNPAAGGIALDTYAILAWLRRDPPMARVILDGLDGDGWLAANLYTGAESFRLLADESWAVRALAVTGVDPPRAAALAAGLCREAQARLAANPDPLARANLALHALAAVRDAAAGAGLAAAGGRTGSGRMKGTLAARLDRAAGAGTAESLADCRSALAEEAVRLLGDPRLRRDTLTLANLLEVLAPEERVATSVLEPALAAILERQEGDGGWSVTEGTKGPGGRVLCTLRCLLALARWREHRLPAAVAAAGGP